MSDKFGSEAPRYFSGYLGGIEEKAIRHFDIDEEGNIIYHSDIAGEKCSTTSVEPPKQDRFWVSMLKRAAMKLWDGFFYGTGLVLVAVWVVVVFEVVGRVTGG